MNSELTQLLEQLEGDNLDFKAAMAFTGYERASLSVDMAAMANTQDGGLLVIGVTNDRAVRGLTLEQLQSFDITKVYDYLKTRFAPCPKVSMKTMDESGRYVLLLTIKEFDFDPVLCTRSISALKNGIDVTVSREGDLWIRDGGASTRIQTEAAMRSLISRALQAHADEVSRSVYQVIRGPIEPISPPPNYEAERDKTASEGAHVMATAGKADAAIWYVSSEPQTPLTVGVREWLHDARFWMSLKAHCQGQYVPYMDMNLGSLGQDQPNLMCLMQTTDRGFTLEHWRLYESGFAGVATATPEDLADRSQFGPGFTPFTVIDMDFAARHLASVLTWLKRLYAWIHYENEIYVSVRVINLTSRNLVRIANQTPWLQPYQNRGNPTFTWSGVLQAVDLTTRPDTLMFELLSRLFALFGFTSDSAIHQVLSSALGNIR